VNRRDMLRAAIGGGAGIALIGLQRACLADTNLDGLPQNVVLDDHGRKLLAAIAETIMPETDTPGAIAAGVPQFVELILSDWYTAEERQPVLEGMAALDEDCASAFGGSFAACTEAQRTEALARTEGSDMFAILKSLTVNGYFTSEVGATSQPGYNPMPGVYREVVFDKATGRWV
jgi:gluconate 2-dehydrogenase gamma chain